MAQNYFEIPSSQKIGESLSYILGNDKTALSCNSGADFPTSNLSVGMLCYRTDQNKLYQLTNTTSKTQVCIADLSGTFRHIDGGAGYAINQTKKSLNDFPNMPTGFYQGTNMTNAPSTALWRVLMIRDIKTSTAENAQQIAFSQSADSVMIRRETNGSWSSWVHLTTAVDGKDAANTTAIKKMTGVSADYLDGYHASNKTASIPISNGTVNTNLNADMLDGRHAGSASGNIPINNGTLNVTLNADMVDSKHVGNSSGQIPVSNGTICANLNAQMVGGITAEKIVKINDKNNLTQTINNATITNLTTSNIYNTKDYTASRQGNRTAVVSRIEGTIDSSSSSGKGNITATTYTLTTETGIPAGNYTIYSALQMLINLSHSHKTTKGSYSYNCNCNCNCDCDCSDDSV